MVKFAIIKKVKISDFAAELRLSLAILDKSNFTFCYFKGPLYHTKNYF